MNRTVRLLILMALLASLMVPLSPAQAGAQPETSIYIIRLWDPAAASYTGGIADLAATSPQVTGARKLDVDSPATAAYVDYLAARQSVLLSSMEQLLGRAIDVSFQYLYAYNGMAVELSADEAAQVARMSGVRSIQLDVNREIDTDMGPYLINADDIWNNDLIPGEFEQGEGVIIGMIDSGINHLHPSFADIGGDGYNHTNPYGSGVYVGWCVANPSFCNDKLIGAYGLNPNGGDPEDTDGHGSHTASTAGGNRHDVSLYGYTRTIQGVAPHANIIAYKVCNPSCPGSASVAAVDLAIQNEVDVLNYSISGGDNPWNDPVDLAFLDAFAAGIFVSASAGNDGPGAGTVAKTGPWNAAVAASTHSRVFANSADVTAPTTPPELQGMPAVPGENVVIGADFVDGIKYDPANLDGCVAFSAGYFTGSMALIQRGACTFATKVTNAANAGATAVVVFNNAGGPPSVMGATPASPASVMIPMDDGLALQAYIDANPTAEVRLNNEITMVLDPAWNDILAGFSSRGPSQYELLKPDYTGPGVNILAAVAADGGDPNQYGLLGGTSMSSPHGAGAAALMVAIKPTWTPAEIKSAIAMGADPQMLDSDGATAAGPFDMGSGRMDLGAASTMGVVMNETVANYEAADPNLGGEPNTLNQPSMVEYNCAGTCTWERAFTSVLAGSQAWTVVSNVPPAVTVTVTPDSFTLAAGETITLTIQADVTTPAEIYYGDITLLPTAAPTVAPARLPIVILAEPAEIVVDPTSMESTQPPAPVQQPLSISNIGDLPLDWEFYDGTPPAPRAPFVDWSDNFDSYVTGSQIHGQGGWKGWFNDPGAGALVSNAFSISSPNSVEIVTASDLVHEYAGYTTGKWRYTAWQYIPSSSTTGLSYFILLNSYDDAGANLNWSTQVSFDLANNIVLDEGVPGGNTLPLIKDQWMEVRIDIDLVNDTQSFYYGGDLLYTNSWTEGVSGGGALNIAAVDLFANGANAVYYDDVSLVEVGWSDNFDSYVTGSQIHGQGGWKGWFNDPGAGALVSNAFSISSPNSVEIVTASDLVHEYAGYTTGKWRYTAWQYIPSSSTTGLSYFILLNSYDDAGANLNWSTQVSFDLANNIVLDEGVPGGNTLPLIKDQWMEIRVDIDLVNDTQSFYYGGDLLYTNSWTEGSSGGGALNIGAVDLYANSANAVYYDDMSLQEYEPLMPTACDVPGDVAWLSTDPASGTTNGGETSLVDVWFDATGMTAGVYTATLCVDSNSIVDPLIGIPVTMTVVAFTYGVELTPPTDAQTGLPGDTVTYTLSLMNNGNYTDTFTLDSAGNTWNVQLPATSVELAAGASTDVIVLVTIPAGTPAGDFDMVTINAVSEGNAGTTDSSVLTTTAGEIYGVELTPATDAQLGLPGEMVAYTLTVANLGNLTDTFEFTSTGNLWTVGLPAAVELAGGDSADVVVNVTVPAGALDGDFDVATIEAASVGDPGMVDSSVLTTTANVVLVYGVELAPATSAFTDTAGAMVAYTLTVTNLGNITDTFTLSYTSDGWTVTLPAVTTIELAAGESQDFVVYVTIPAGAVAGDMNTATITATSEGDPLVTDAAELQTYTTGPGSYNIFLPIVMRYYP